MRRWLARLSFSFFILGAVLGYDAYKHRPPGSWRRTAQLAGAAALVALGLIGTRERHREAP